MSPAERSVNASGRAQGADADIEWVAGDGVLCVQTDETRCSVAPGTKLTLRAPEVAGHRFSGWTGGEGCKSESPVLQLTVRDDVDCVANYVRRVKVTGTVESGGVMVRSDSPFATCSDNQCVVDVGATVTLEAPLRDGFKLTGWDGVGCEAGTRDGYKLNLAAKGDTSCTAQFTASLTVRAAASGNDAEPSVTSSAPGAACSPLICAVDPGSAVDLKAPEVAGFRFTGWSGDPSCTSVEPNITVGNVQASITCTASYVARFTARAESTGSDPAPALTASSSDAFARCDGTQGALCEVDQGGSVSLFAGTVNGYRLVEWTGEGCQAQVNGASTTLANLQANTVCTARYARGVSVSGTLRNATGAVVASSTAPGATCDAGSCAIDAGGSVTLVAPSIQDRTFLEWSGDEGCRGTDRTLTLDNVTSSRSCVATYAPRYRVGGVGEPTSLGSVAASAPGATARCEGGSCEVNEGTVVTLDALPSDGSRFVGWSGGGACTGSNTRLVLPGASANLSCRAQYVARVTVTSGVTPDDSGETVASSSSAQAQCEGGSCTVDSGSTVSLTAEPNEGYRFVQWSECSDSDANPLTSPVEESIRCVARLERITYVVSATAGLGGNVSASSGGGACDGARCVVPYGESAQLSAVADAGFVFAGWTGCGTSMDSPLTIPSVTSNVSCTATFMRMRFTVSATAPGGGGSVAATTGSMTCPNASCGVDFGGTVVLRATPDAAHDFGGWSCGGNDLTRTIGNVMANQTCAASFTPKRYTFTLLASNGGGSRISAGTGATCTGNTCEVTHGGSVTLNVTSAGRFYTFAGWTCSNSTSGEVSIDNITANGECQANFTLNSYAVNASVDGVGSIEVTPNVGTTCNGSSCTVNGGSSVTFRAVQTDSLNTFQGWTCSVGTPASSANATLTFSDVGAPHTCTANFRRTVFRVTVEGAQGLDVAAIFGAGQCPDNVCLVNTTDVIGLVASSDPQQQTIFTGWSCSAATPPQANIEATNLQFSSTLSGVTEDVTCRASSEPLAIALGYQQGGETRPTYSVDKLHVCRENQFDARENRNVTFCYVPVSATVTWTYNWPGRAFNFWSCDTYPQPFDSVDYRTATINVSGFRAGAERACQGFPVPII